MRSIELLKVFIHHEGGRGVACISCCGALKMSNQSTTSPDSGFDSKKNNTESIVSENLFCHVWLTPVCPGNVAAALRVLQHCIAQAAAAARGEWPDDKITIVRGGHVLVHPPPPLLEHL